MAIINHNYTKMSDSDQKIFTGTLIFESRRGNTMTIKFPQVERCACTKSKPADDFKNLIELVKQAWREVRC